MSTIEPGQLWLQRAIPAEGYRRVVEVTDVDERYIAGVGWWQQETGRGGWRDVPQTSRRTRVLATAFRRQYDQLGPTVDVDASRVVPVPDGYRPVGDAYRGWRT